MFSLLLISYFAFSYSYAKPPSPSPSPIHSFCTSQKQPSPQHPSISLDIHTPPLLKSPYYLNTLLLFYFILFYPLPPSHLPIFSHPILTSNSQTTNN